MGGNVRLDADTMSGELTAAEPGVDADRWLD